MIIIQIAFNQRWFQSATPVMVILIALLCLKAYPANLYYSSNPCFYNSAGVCLFQHTAGNGNHSLPSFSWQISHCLGVDLDFKHSCLGVSQWRCLFNNSFANVAAWLLGLPDIWCDGNWWIFLTLDFSRASFCGQILSCVLSFSICSTREKGVDWSTGRLMDSLVGDYWHIWWFRISRVWLSLPWLFLWGILSSFEQRSKLRLWSLFSSPLSLVLSCRAFYTLYRMNSQSRLVNQATKETSTPQKQESQ